jgi:NADPH-dependent curcumin reductase CurA
VFYDNVGGHTLEAALDNLRVGARVVICGRISQTAGGEPYGVRNLGLLIGKRARVQGFAVSDFAYRYFGSSHLARRASQDRTFAATCSCARRT